MPNKYLDSVQLGRLITKIKTYINTAVAGYLPTSGGSITGNLTVSGTITGDVTGTASGNLPLSGGTLTGPIINSDTLIITGSTASSRTVIAGGNATASGDSVTYSGAGISLSGNGYGNPGGAFSIRADDGTDSVLLNGYPSGTLKWNSKEIERINSSGSNYIRFESGLQIVFGNGTTSNPPTSVTFPAAFSATPGIAMVHISTVSNGGNYTKIASISSTAFTPILTTSSSYVATSYRYVAIGKWK